MFRYVCLHMFHSMGWVIVSRMCCPGDPKHLARNPGLAQLGFGVVWVNASTVTVCDAAGSVPHMLVMASAAMQLP